MTKRQSLHPDNELIDDAAELPMPGQGGSAGGGTSRSVGSRAELERATGEDAGVERVTGSDDPVHNERKGAKSLDKLNSPR
ncbi:MAG TPA: hypothetical protein VF418_13580 [Sphingomonadaceae bacterium]